MIIEKDNGQIQLFCKGANDVIDPLINKNDSPYYDKIIWEMNKYSRVGLRTLLLCERRLNPNVFKKWKSQYEKALA